MPYRYKHQSQGSILPVAPNFGTWTQEAAAFPAQQHLSRTQPLTPLNFHYSPPHPRRMQSHGHARGLSPGAREMHLGGWVLELLLSMSALTPSICTPPAWGSQPDIQPRRGYGHAGTRCAVRRSPGLLRSCSPPFLCNQINRDEAVTAICTKKSICTKPSIRNFLFLHDRSIWRAFYL